tara:strand:+ start:553 stop:1194 length:642 start_codon:yes stop_codon:yes gene_type:complete
MKNNDQSILGIYSYVDLLINSIKQLRKKGFENIRVFSPCPIHEIEDSLDTGKEPSKVKYFTLTGAILGALVGVAFTVLTSMDWPIVTSAKPIVSIPPYMIIIFECMVLIGGLSTFLGLIINARLRKDVPHNLYDERFTNDKFGILVHCSPSHLEEVESILKEFGSEEIKINGAPVVEEKILDTKEEEAPKEESKAEEAPQEEVATIEDEKDED